MAFERAMSTSQRLRCQSAKISATNNTLPSYANFTCYIHLITIENGLQRIYHTYRNREREERKKKKVAYTDDGKFTGENNGEEIMKRKYKRVSPLKIDRSFAVLARLGCHISRTWNFPVK